MDDVAMKYSIIVISKAAPKGPNLDNELTPKVNC